MHLFHVYDGRKQSDYTCTHEKKDTFRISTSSDRNCSDVLPYYPEKGGKWHSNTSDLWSRCWWFTRKTSPAQNRNRTSSDYVEAELNVLESFIGLQTRACSQFDTPLRVQRDHNHRTYLRCLSDTSISFLETVPDLRHIVSAYCGQLHMHTGYSPHLGANRVLLECEVLYNIDTINTGMAN